MTWKRSTSLVALLTTLLTFMTSACQNNGGDQDATSRPDLATQAFDSVNEQRRQSGRTLLTWNGTVAGIAEAHSLDMAIGKTAFGHDGFTERLNQLRASLDFTTAGENVGYAVGQSNPVKVIVDGWMQKTDHRANILGDFQLSGIGAAQGPDGEIYITQIFLKTN